MGERSTSVESWVLMSLIYRDLDDGDYKNALLLSERLYAINNSICYYKFMYATCLFHCLDYNASYTILKAAKSVPCLNLFAKSCLELGKLEESKERQRQLWEDGVQALLLALSLNELPEQVFWGDELTSVTNRNHMPSKASICNLLGDLYVKLDNIRAASIYYWDCLKSNPFKMSAYMKLCDIAPDCVDFDKTKLPEDIFIDFNISSTNLSKSPNAYLPVLPSTDVSEISFSTPLTVDQVRKNSFSMPGLKDNYRDITVSELRALIKHSSSILEADSPLLKNQPQRGDIENSKSEIIETLNNDINEMKVKEAYKNKHGLHKKPPTQAPQKLRVELAEDESDDVPDNDKLLYDIKSNAPPRLSPLKQQEEIENGFPNKRVKLEPNRAPKPKPVAVADFFLPSTNTQNNTQGISKHIIDGMNKVKNVLCILANGYMHQSFYHCETAALELQKLDDQQYNSARVLCILGKAYYDAGDYPSARTLYKQAFVIAPWYCEGVPFYSTCLWYLEKEMELNLLAFKMRDNKSHLYEAYIAAGNWTKSTKGGNEATQWFEKSVKLDPSQSYGHALLGYEEWEKGNSLGAKQHFSRSLVTNKRSYIGWYGMATTYMSMQQYKQARTLLEEAVRLHPRHPVVLATMAEVLVELGEYQLAKDYIDKSLIIKANESNEKLREKIKLKIHQIEQQQ